MDHIWRTTGFKVEPGYAPVLHSRTSSEPMTEQVRTAQNWPHIAELTPWIGSRSRSRLEDGGVLSEIGLAELAHINPGLSPWDCRLFPWAIELPSFTPTSFTKHWQPDMMRWSVTSKQPAQEDHRTWAWGTKNPEWPCRLTDTRGLGIKVIGKGRKCPLMTF